MVAQGSGERKYIPLRPGTKMEVKQRAGGELELVVDSPPAKEIDNSDPNGDTEVVEHTGSDR